MTMEPAQIYNAVREHYSAASKGSTSGKYESNVAKAFGYSDEELQSIPKDSNLGLSCGNPIALANLKDGETVVDLGSGAGFDIFLASKKVGSTGQAIGVDMNEDMIAKAEQNKTRTGANNVTFIESPITNIPALPNGSVDCVISNCVINLVPEGEKQLVFNEMARALKSGGRLAISDILLKTDLPPELQSNMALYVGCIAGASKVGGYKDYLKRAGFQDIRIIDGEKDLNVYKSSENGNVPCCGSKKESSCCAPTSASNPQVQSGKSSCCSSDAKNVSTDAADIDFNAWAGSFHIFGIKP